jgi:hypothetical protein
MKFWLYTNYSRAESGIDVVDLKAGEGDVML